MSVQAELVRYYRWLRQFGYNDSHSGNASVRDGERIWITPSGACAEVLTAEQVVACTRGEQPPEAASLDAPLHLQVYNKNARATAVLHSHGPYSVALTLGGHDFVPIDFEGQYYFTSVPVITIPYEQYVPQSPDLVSDYLQEHRVVIVRGHGVYACGESLNLAYKWTCSLELSAKTAFIARTAGVADATSGCVK